MNFKLFDLYADYLLSSFAATTATGMSALMDKAISHDQVSRMLNSQQLEPKDWWQIVKHAVRTTKNHYALKTHLYLSALRQAFDALRQLEPVRLHALTA